MNIILAEENEIENEQLVLTDHRATHIVKVLRAEIGDSVRLGVINGLKGTGIIETIEKKHPRSVSIRVNLTEAMNSRPQIDLIVALARPIMMRRILSQATALGVGRFLFTHANRVEKSFWEASLLEQENYQEHLLLGLEQAVDTRMPEVSYHRRFKPFIEDVIPSIAEEYSHLLLAHPDAELTLTQGMKGNAERILLAIGPEGGWVDFEVNKFTEAGFQTCSLGERILKVDTAVISIHSRISQILEMKTSLETVPE